MPARGHLQPPGNCMSTAVGANLQPSLILRDGQGLRLSRASACRNPRCLSCNDRDQRPAQDYPEDIDV